MELAVSGGSEVREVHTRLLRMGLVPDESQVYWRHAPSDRHPGELVETAFQERWFGAKSMARVRYLLTGFGYRFYDFAGSLEALKSWDPADLHERQVVCATGTCS